MATFSSFGRLLGDYAPSSPLVCTAMVLALLLYTLHTLSFRSNLPIINGIPEAPGSLPFIGHLRPLGGRQEENDCTVYSRWSNKLGADLFQMKLGNERTIVANSFQVIKDLWVGHSNELIDRPFQHGFADKLDYDLSGAAMTEPIRRCRKAAMRALGKPLWTRYYPLLEPSSVNFIKNAFVTGGNGAAAIEAYPFLRQIVFDLALSLTYGTHMTGENNDFVMTLIRSINNISSLRASTRRYRDYTPVLRLLVPDSLSGNVVVSSERIRQRHLDVIYADLQARRATGEDIHCVVTGLVNDKLSLPEAHGVCKALLQAAPDSTASSIYMGVAWLCSPTGRSFQSELYGAIMTVYNGDRNKAWDMAFREETVALVVSFYKETLRYWTTTPYATPRSTTVEIRYGDTIIPRGVTAIMNAQHGNHDKAWYGNDAETFIPTRFVGNDTSLPHLTFGAGSRVCPAAALSNRIIYAMLIRLILAYEMDEASGLDARRPNLDMLDFSNVYGSLVAAPRRYECHYTARDQEWLRSKWELAQQAQREEPRS